MTVTCIKGSEYHGMSKGRVYPVVEMGTFGKQITITIQDTDRVKKFYVPMTHKNRVNSGLEFNVNTGDPTRKVRLRLNSHE